MKTYHKIQTVFKRDPETNFKTVIFGDWALPEFEYLRDNSWIITEKIDGTNIRIMWDGEKITYGGKTDNAQIPAFLVNRLQEIITPDQIRETFPDTQVTLYGEGYGAKIQKGGGNYIPDGVDFILFDVLCGDTWLKRESIEDISTKLGIKIVPIVEVGNIMCAVSRAKQKTKSTFGDFMAEGFVMKPSIELFDRMGRRIVSKIKCKDFGGI